MAGLWLSIKRGKSYIDVYHKGEKICTIKVSDQNRGNQSILSLESSLDTRFKMEKETQIESEEENFNKEKFNV